MCRSSAISKGITMKNNEELDTVLYKWACAFVFPMRGEPKKPVERLYVEKVMRQGERLIDAFLKELRNSDVWLCECDNANSVHLEYCLFCGTDKPEHVIFRKKTNDDLSPVHCCHGFVFSDEHDEDCPTKSNAADTEYVAPCGCHGDTMCDKHAEWFTNPARH